MHMIPYINKLIATNNITTDEVRLLAPSYVMLMVNKTQVTIKRKTHKGVKDTLIMSNIKKEVIAIGFNEIAKTIESIRETK